MNKAIELYRLFSKADHVSLKEFTKLIKTGHDKLSVPDIYQEGKYYEELLVYTRSEGEYSPEDVEDAISDSEVDVRRGIYHRWRVFEKKIYRKSEGVPVVIKRRLLGELSGTVYAIDEKDNGVQDVQFILIDANVQDVCLTGADTNEIEYQELGGVIFKEREIYTEVRAELRMSGTASYIEAEFI